MNGAVFTELKWTLSIRSIEVKIHLILATAEVVQLLAYSKTEIMH